jgi:hypothetical protein
VRVSDHHAFLFCLIDPGIVSISPTSGLSTGVIVDIHDNSMMNKAIVIHSIIGSCFVLVAVIVSSLLVKCYLQSKKNCEFTFVTLC